MSFENLLNYMNQEILALMYWDKERCSNINDFIITKLVSDTYKIKPLPVDCSKKLEKRLHDLDIKCSSENISKLFSHIKNFNSYIVSGTPHKQNTTPVIENILDQYKERSLPAHKQLANKQALRGQPVVAGSRIEYLILEHSNDPNAKQFDKLEDPDYFCSRCTLLRLDRLAYVKSIVMCIDQLFNVVYVDHSDPISKLYQFHVNHYKIMKHIKNLSKTDIVYKK